MDAAALVCIQVQNKRKRRGYRAKTPHAQKGNISQLASWQGQVENGLCTAHQHERTPLSPEEQEQSSKHEQRVLKGLQCVHVLKPLSCSPLVGFGAAQHAQNTRSHDGADCWHPRWTCTAMRDVWHARLATNEHPQWIKWTKAST
eukprot:1137360-Pelagomonas_calceolata.AAC.3